MEFFTDKYRQYKAKKELQDAVEAIRFILEDEEFQLQLVNPTMRAIIKKGRSCDRNPNGTGPFGYTETNPIPANGPIGQLAYFSKLETENGERILFHRIGAIDLIDVFEAVTFSGSAWYILYSDFYHPIRSRIAPEGLRFTHKLGQFTGFHTLCANFPYDFMEMKEKERKTGLADAYIATGRVLEQMSKSTYTRPMVHKERLKNVTKRLTSGEMPYA